MISKIDFHFKPIDICLHWLDYKRDKKNMRNLVTMFIRQVKL